MLKNLKIYEMVINATVPVEIKPSLYALKVNRKDKKRRKDFPEDINYRKIICVQKGIYKITCNCCGKEFVFNQDDLERRTKITIEECIKNDEKFIYYCNNCKPNSGKINCKDCKMGNHCPLYDESREYNSFLKGVGCMTIHNAKINTSKLCIDCNKKEKCEYYDETREINYFVGSVVHQYAVALWCGVHVDSHLAALSAYLASAGGVRSAVETLAVERMCVVCEQILRLYVDVVCPVGEVVVVQSARHDAYIVVAVVYGVVAEAYLVGQEV